MRMSDPSEKQQVSVSEEPSGHQSFDRVSTGGSCVKTCADCGTSKTPLWRSGPAGPKSLCNACGIKSRKKRGALLGPSKDDKKSKKTSQRQQNQSNSKNHGGINKSGDSLRRRLLAIPREITFQRPRSTSTVARPRRKMGEEEQAAFLLLALSSGSVYAY